MMIAITAVCRVEYSICGSGTASDDDEMMILMMMMMIIIIMATTLMMMTAILGMMARTCVPGAIASLHSCRICSHRGQGCVGSVRPGHHGDWCQQGQQYR